jgi:hypothetical protein
LGLFDVTRPAFRKEENELYKRRSGRPLVDRFGDWISPGWSPSGSSALDDDRRSRIHDSNFFIDTRGQMNSNFEARMVED